MEITGQVKNNKGEPVPQANVLITRASVPFPEIGALSNVDGWFKLADLAPGEYTVSAFHLEFVAHYSLNLTVSKEIELVLGVEPGEHGE